MNPVDLAYAAGLFDGEGCIFIHRTTHETRNGLSYSYTLGVVVSMVDREPVAFMGELFGGSVRGRPVQGTMRRPQYYWRLQGKNALACLLLVRPYLRSKVAQADLGIAFGERMAMVGNPGRARHPLALKEWQEASYRQMRHLKGSLTVRGRKRTRGTETREGVAT